MVKSNSVCLMFALSVLATAASPVEDRMIRTRLTVLTPLQHTNTPLDPTINFGQLINQANRSGVLDPNSIEVIDAATKQRIPHALTEDFFYSDKGRIEFVIDDPKHSVFEIRFETANERPAIVEQSFIPMIGVGDLLRFNGGRPRRVSVPYAPGLHDLNGDGRLDLTGSWNYAYRPGGPWDGILCFPRTDDKGYRFGGMQRLRFISDHDGEPEFLSHTYMAVDFADFNRDGLIDLVTTRNGTGSASIFLNTGIRDKGGLPRFKPGGSVKVDGWQACRAVDLDHDGAIDLVVDGQFVRNRNEDGWPFQAAQPVRLNAGRKPCFMDVDGDGWLDSICLQGQDSAQPDFYKAAWRRNLNQSTPQFGPEEQLSEVDLPEISFVGSWRNGERAGLIVQHHAFQQVSFYQRKHRPAKGGSAKRGRFEKLARAESVSAVLTCGDQAWPCLCDWDEDGDQDLLVGGGYGWPKIVINEGTRRRPRYREPERVLSVGKPIRFVRNQILGEPNNWHDMGYCYPIFTDWDGDGRKDLICPNETNRIFWFRNVGTRHEPEFGPRQQIICDDYPDSAVMRSLSNQRANDPESNNGVYPFEKERPFLWRTGVAVADFNGDSLMDLVTHDGQRRVATLFVQYRCADGLRLRKERVLKLEDGRPINDTIVDRQAHWTESFRAIDWDQDGLQDLIYSVAGAQSGTKDNGSIYLLRNTGTVTQPKFGEPETMRCFGEPIRITNHGPHPWPGDFDGDGKPDLIACVEWSVYPWYSYAALMMKKRPETKLELLERADSEFP